MRQAIPWGGGKRLNQPDSSVAYHPQVLREVAIAAGQDPGSREQVAIYVQCREQIARIVGQTVRIVWARRSRGGHAGWLADRGGYP